jgi:hypothetical protein
LATAGSDVFSFTTSQLTLNKLDFSSASGGGDLAIHLTPRLDLSLGASYSGTSRTSEFRNWVDQDDLPITQETSFQRLPVTASLKWYFTPRGRSLSRFAWVPTRLAFYAGAGGGVMWYRFRQRGDFVDFETLAVFPDRFEGSGWTPTAHALLGADFSLSPRFALSAETRYTVARGNLGLDFVGFDPIDLSGLSATLGVAVRF